MEIEEIKENIYRYRLLIIAFLVIILMGLSFYLGRLIGEQQAYKICQLYLEEIQAKLIY